MRFMELQLIQLYLWVCLVYDKHPMLKYQRLSNNYQPLFTDQELITVYWSQPLVQNYALSVQDFSCYSPLESGKRAT